METEFWGVEVKRGEPLKVLPGYGTILHLSQASLGEHKNEKGKESVSLFVNVDGKKLVLGTLITNKLPQHQFDLLFDREFELSHDWKGGSVYFYGYKASNSLGEDESLEGESDESIFESDDEEYIPLNLANNGKSKSKDEQVKPELKAKQEKFESNAEQEKSESQVSSRKKKARKLLSHETGDFLEKPEAKAQQEKPELRAEQKKPEANTEQEKPELRDEQKKPEPNAEQERTYSKVKRKKRKLLSQETGDFLEKPEAKAQQEKPELRAEQKKPEGNTEQEKPELRDEQKMPEPNAEQEKTYSKVKRKKRKLLSQETGDFLEKPEAKAQQEKPELRAEQNKPEANTDQEKPELRDEEKKPEPNAEQEKTDSKVERNKKKRKKVKRDKPAEAERCNAPNKESDAGKDSVKVTETHKDVNPKEDDESSYEDLMSDDDEEDKSQVSSLSKWGKKKTHKLLPHETDGNEAVQTPPIDQANKQTPEPGKAHTCKTCNKSFTTEKGVEFHTKAKHGDGKSS